MAKDIKHLKTTCEHCGHAIDMEKDGACPRCGATYGESKNVSRYNSLQDKMNQIQVDTAEAELESIKLDNARKKQQLKENEKKNENYYTPPTTTYQPTTYETTKSGGGIVKKIIIVLLIIFMVPLLFRMCMNGGVRNDNNDDNTTQEEVIVETPVEVGFNEKAELIQYSIICDKVEDYRMYWNDPKEGLSFVRLHLVITNNTKKDLKVWDSMKCTYLKGDYYIDASTVNASNDDGAKICGKTIKSGSTVEGWVYFEIPYGADIKLYCGDYVTITMSTAPTDDGQTVEVGFGEKAETNRYSITCDKATQFNPYFGSKEGMMDVSFNLIVQNKMTCDLEVPATIKCFYEKDGALIECERSHNGDEITSDIIGAGVTSEGGVGFSIPIGAEVIIVYNDYVSIRIPFENITKLGE